MAYSTPSTRAAGYVVPYTVWNSDVVDNVIALRTGAIALSSQAAGDVIYATTTTQLGRVAIGTSGYVLTSNGSAPAWSNTPTLTGTNITGIPAASILAGTFGSGNYTIPGLLTVSGFGTHTFSAGGTGYQILSVRNTTATATGGVGFYLGNDASSSMFNIFAFSSSQGGSDSNHVVGTAEGAGGLTFKASHASGDVRIYSRNALAATFGASQAATFLGDITVSKGGYDSFFKTDATGLKIGHNSSIRNIEFQINSTTVAKIDTNGDFYTNDGTVSSLSDQRLKTEVRGFSAGLAEVLALSPKVYVYRDDVPGFQRATDKEFVSDIAQRLQTLIPEAVKQNGDWLAVAQEGPIVWALVNAIQELAAEVDALRASAGLAKKVRTMNPVVGDDRAVKSPPRVIVEEPEEGVDEGGESGTPNYVTYDRVTAYLVAVVQQQQAEIDALKAQMKEKQ